MELSIILPCYNEEENIDLIEKELINVLKEDIRSFEIIAVDDGSCDDTYNRLRYLHEKYPFVKVLRHQKNEGLGAAIKTGIENSSYDFVVTLDADLTFHPRDIKNLVKAFLEQNVDFVVGSPFLFGYNRDIPFYRRWLSKFCNLLYRLALGRKITAITPIFRLYRLKDLDNLILQSTGFTICAEIMAKLILNGKTFVEIPTKLGKRRYGESKINVFKEIKSHLKMIKNILIWRFM